MTAPIQETMASFLIKWTPRATVVLVGGYYGLGIAYERGWMALIDKVAIQALKYFFWLCWDWGFYAASPVV